ncbi:hypothetical protein [Pseudonocardia sp.]|uniref:hypothetical protein n=1 Tax=Pseudonocardia sp. TaxID=60912 RepID=UPI002605E239|nr:hypothetical protein [Pseudonocardia sp.]
MREQQKPGHSPPANRATRRGNKPADPAPARDRGAPVSARPAQGRRVNPVRRTG